MSPSNPSTRHSQHLERGALAPRFHILCDRLSLIRGGVSIFRDFSTSTPFSGLLLIKGPVGAGKTTLLKILAGIIPPGSGSAVIMNGEVPATHTYLHANPEFNFVTGNIIDELLFASLDPAEFSDYIDRSVFDLSGGEMKKLSIHMGLKSGADVVLADEPFDMLDDHERAMMSDTIVAASRQTGFVVATHDDVLDKHADAILVIEAVP